MTYWHRAARLLRTYVHELQDTESQFSTEVLALEKHTRHLEQLVQMHRDALADANRYIEALERDREADRRAAYLRGLNHRGDTPADDDTRQDSALPGIDPAGPNLRTRWFRSRADALDYARNFGFSQPPERRRVWLDLAWRDEWSLRVPA